MCSVPVSKFRLTTTRDEKVVNRANIEQVRALAFLALHALAPPADLGWAQFKKIAKWDGKHLVLRYGTDSIALEQLQ